MNDCTNCRNKPYRNGVGGPCPECVENSNWQNDIQQRIADEAPAPTVATDINTTLAERGSRYGKFTGHAAVSCSLKYVIWRELSKRDKLLTHDQQEALDMICHKIGRIINGDPDYADSWIDIAGYAKLVADRLEGVER